ncbi:helix-turn-helix domain-containing protein [Candidatus Micrarchaeota archaeon]|nr:helix-turn-helix domain-containing protein [Candidatus Micrarchaeota archaeon]
MEPKLLERFGLTPGEVRVYLALLSLGDSTTGPLAQESRVSSSKVYKVLGRLQRKGLCGHILKGGVKRFRATDPTRLLDYLEEKESELEKQRILAQQLIPELVRLHQTAPQPAQATVLYGLRAVTNFFRNILDELHSGETYHVLGGGYGQEASGLREFFHAFHHRRAKKKIRVMILANHSVKGKMVPTSLRCSQIRVMPRPLISNMQITFYHNKALISLWTKEPMGFYIENEEAVRSFRTYFDDYWKRAPVYPGSKRDRF